MKPIIITPKRIRKELFIWLGALLIAVLLNVYSILKYKTSWTELVSQLGYVIAISIVLYLLAALIRGIVHFVKR